MSEEHSLIAQRRQKLHALREQGFNYPVGFQVSHQAQSLHEDYQGQSREQLENQAITVVVAGRIMTRRVMGKASFVQLRDRSGDIQLFLRQATLNEQYDQFRDWDIGDIVGAKGVLFKTKTGELSVRVEDIQLISKSLRPLPEKYHGLADREICYRQRYLDLIMSTETRQRFRLRSACVQTLRHFLDERDFIEVETPMMHAIPGGAVARPFVTHHNALGRDFYLRVAPELHLKRLVVGGLERVYEINRCFRNEGLSTRHNPEFTTLEFYLAYADYQDLMQLTEQMLNQLVARLLDNQQVNYQGQVLNFTAPFKRLSVKDGLLQTYPTLSGETVQQYAILAQLAQQHNIKVQTSWGVGRLQMELFEAGCEQQLQQPTFVTQLPTEVSPLARRNDADPTVTDRFELYIAGREIANGFSELNDPEDQAQRFHQQVKEKEAGDGEAMHFDADYIRALEYGMPPAAGLGLGIDRLLMLLTNAESIRDVLLFPHLRPESSLKESHYD